MLRHSAATGVASDPWRETALDPDLALAVAGHGSHAVPAFYTLAFPGPRFRELDPAR